MGSKLSSHVRHNVIGYLALFFALTGSAVGATAVLKVGDSAGGDLAGTYPNPTIRDGAVTGGTLGKVADNSITGADVNESTLSGVPPGGAAGGDLTGTYPNPTIAGGVVGTGNFSRTIRPCVSTSPPKSRCSTRLRGRSPSRSSPTTRPAFTATRWTTPGYGARHGHLQPDCRRTLALRPEWHAVRCNPDEWVRRSSDRHYGSITR